MGPAEGTHVVPAAPVERRAAAGWRPSAAACWTLAFALLVPWAEFCVQHDIGLNLADEGFVWYAAQRALLLEIPQRDFQSYDIGRCYWYAGWMWLTGSIGLYPLRLGSAVLASASVALAARLVHGQHRAPPWQATALGVLTVWLWMVPDYKLADALAIVLTAWGLTQVHRVWTPWSGFGFGVCLGVASLIGINHALYGTVGALLSLAVAWHRQRRFPSPPMFAAAVAGFTLGYAPVLGFHLFVPGFSAAFVDDLRRLQEAGTTNLWVPLPRLGAWLSADGPNAGPAIRESLTALVCLGALAFLLACAARLGRRDGPAVPDAPQVSPAFIAAVSLSVPYLHYAWSRLDIVHLAISVLPVILALYTAPARRWSGLRFSACAAVFLASLALALPEHPWFRALRGGPLEAVVVQSETLRVQPITASNLRLLDRLVAGQAEGRPFYAAPFWPGAYAVFAARAPVWEIYPLFPATARRQQTEIDTLAAADIGFAVVNTFNIDDRVDAGLARTHPLLAAYLQRCLQRVEMPETQHQQVDVYRRDATAAVPRDRAGCDRP